MPNPSASPVSNETVARFRSAMQQLGPFENSPHLAIATSGGADSMALTLLVHAWAKEYGGHITALTVDHGLRPESAPEAQQVAQWLAQHDIAHEILTLEALPEGNLQAEARNARYAALTEWCCQHHVLHLLTGHHADDQVETILMREARSERSLGASGMSAQHRQKTIRILRPLLQTHKTMLVEYMQSREQTWVEEPSNQNEQFERVRIRKRLAQHPEETQTAIERGATNARKRIAAEQHIAHWCAQNVQLHPAGYAVAALDALPDPSVLSSLIQTISGEGYPVRTASLEQAMEQLPAQETVSIGGCLLKRMGETHLVFREPNAMADSVPLDAQGSWDGRYSYTTTLRDEAYRIGALSEEGWLSIKDHFKQRPLPRPLLPTLPALKHLDTVLCVPHIGYEVTYGLLAALQLRWQPRKPLAGAPFTAMNDAY